MNKILKKNKGVMLTDGIIATLIVILFLGIITSLITSINSEKTKIKSNSMLIQISTDILEYVDSLSFSDTTENNITSYVNNKNIANIQAGTSLEGLTAKYKVIVEVKGYQDIVGDNSALNIVKEVTITLKENDTDSMVVSRVKKASDEEIENIIQNLNSN